VRTRRELIRAGTLAGGALALGPGFWEALARPARRARSPYGHLVSTPDANGIRLPEGFSSRLIARGNEPVGDTGYLWHVFSDGASTFRAGDGGWILVSNSEIPTPVELPIDPPVGDPGDGGASAIRFHRDGGIVDAYRILSDTSSNCAGGATPWGTWLSCEETESGRVWECDPAGENEPQVRDPLGVFSHEAVCVDPERGHVYLSEDDAAGGFYRFTPTRKDDLSEGVLKVADRRSGGHVRWIEVPDPSAATAPTREQVPEMTRFRRGEGIWFDSDRVYLATTGDSRIWSYNVNTRRMRVIYDAEKIKRPPLREVDNITVSRSGDLFVCEDTGDPDGIDIAIITPGPGRRVARFLKLDAPRHGAPNTEARSEVAGVCFNPRGDRMYLASQRANVFGEVYEVTGPFRRRA
jgi:secreted PhoX family phosphatase